MGFASKPTTKSCPAFALIALDAFVATVSTTEARTAGNDWTGVVTAPSVSVAAMRGNERVVILLKYGTVIVAPVRRF